MSHFLAFDIFSTISCLQDQTNILKKQIFLNLSPSEECYTSEYSPGGVIVILIETVQAAERGEELPPRGERRFCPYQVKSATGGQSNQLSGVRKAGDTPLDLNSTQNCSTSISETKTDTSVTPSSGTVDEEKCKNQEKLAKDQDQPTINSELNKQETTNNNTEKSATTTTTTTTQEATQLTTS